eukprot:6650617-Prymnesium_polylepis.1
MSCTMPVVPLTRPSATEMLCVTITLAPKQRRSSLGRPTSSTVRAAQRALFGCLMAGILMAGI